MNRPIWYLATVLAPLVCLFADVPRASAQGLGQQAYVVLDKYCFRCHNRTKLSGDFDASEHSKLKDVSGNVDYPYVTPKDPSKSYLWVKIDKKEMPPGSAQQPNDAERAIIKKWIEAGAEAWEGAGPKRAFVSNKEVVMSIYEHMRMAETDDQRYRRYFTVNIQHNDPRIKEEQLKLFKAGLSKALNSMSWKRGIVRLEPVDKNATVFWFDLRDLDWEQKPGERYDRWTWMMANYGYGLRMKDCDDDDLRKADVELYRMAGNVVNYMRADWFMTTATRPPLYHDILRIPHDAGTLERRLGVDVADNFKRNRLWRAGYTNSGVSRQHRMIERHDSLFGNYWKSYDFKQGTSKNNLMQFPLGPDFSGSDAYRKFFPYKEAAFEQDGGEIIFSLPNGLQGYMLLDGKDRRINAGPSDVVFDEKSTSGTSDIVTGISCMSCHNKGMIYGKNRQDAVRFGASVEGDLRVKVKRIYSAPETMDRFFKKDEEQFLTAAKEAVEPFYPLEKGKEFQTLSTMPEPLGIQSIKYRLDDLKLEDVAYELGFESPKELEGALRGNSRLRELGLAVLLKGGGMKRFEWDGSFLKDDKAIQRLEGASMYQRVMRELGLGTPSNVIK